MKTREEMKALEERYREKMENSKTTEEMEEAKMIEGLNRFAIRVHENAREHGWWDEPRTDGEIVALIHSELSEALEEMRDGKPPIYIEDGKPKGVGVELADAIIRILDYCAAADIDIERAIYIKHQYNKTRPYKHGGKRF